MLNVRLIVCSPRLIAAAMLVPGLVAAPRLVAREALRPVTTGYHARPGATVTAVFAGGCFWSMERPFDHVPGVISTVVGYAGGTVDNPTYAQVNSGTTGYAESVQVTYDSTRVSYAKLLDVYWHNVDPFTRDAQFCDAGNEYRTIIFYANDAQKEAAEQSRDAIAVSMRARGPVVTQIVPATKFWPAEEYHQHYADRNVMQYLAYSLGCGRDGRLHELWGDAAEPYVPNIKVTR